MAPDTYMYDMTAVMWPASDNIQNQYLLLTTTISKKHIYEQEGVIYNPFLIITIILTLITIYSAEYTLFYI